LISIGLYSDSFIEDRLRNQRNINPPSSSSPTPSEQSHVQKIINRFETPSTTKTGKQLSRGKSLRDDHSDGSGSITSSPPVKRVARRGDNDTNLINENGSNHRNGFVVQPQPKEPRNEVFFGNNKNMSNGTKFELNKEEILNTGRRTASGTTVSIVWK
jgi:hypothetical protein